MPPSDASQTTGESERYQQFLQEQNTRMNGWGEERRKKLEQSTPNIRPLQPSTSPVTASPIRNPAPKEIPIAVIPPSPLKRERELQRTLHAAKKLKEELEQERATLREEFKRKDAELKRREEQMQTNISDDVRKVSVYNYKTRFSDKLMFLFHTTFCFSFTLCSVKKGKTSQFSTEKLLCRCFNDNLQV